MKIHAHTERLLIRDWTRDDFDAYFAIVSDPEVMKHIGNGLPRTREYVDGFFESVLSHQETRGWTRFAVEHRQSGKVMGFCGLDDQTGRIDFGWRFGREFWGAGYGFEAASAVLWVAQNTFKLTQITCQSYPDNVGSIRIMEKMGMSKIGEEVVFSRPTLVYGFEAEWPNGV